MTCCDNNLLTSENNYMLNTQYLFYERKKGQTRKLN